jgi:hypothetical protein
MEKKQTPVQVLDEIVEVGEDVSKDEEFQKFVGKIITFISHEIEVNKDDKVFQSHNSLHKKLMHILNAQYRALKK